ADFNNMDPGELLAVQMRSTMHHEVLDAMLKQNAQAAQRELEKIDFEEVCIHAEEALGDDVLPGLPANYARDRLIAAYQLDPKLQEAWDHRWDSKESLAHAQAMIKRTIKSMAKDARAAAAYDHEATADRFAVAAAVRGSNLPRGPAPPPDYGNMT